MRSFLCVRDLCGTFYPQGVGIGDAQHRARLLAIQDKVRLLEQATDVGARVMPRHRMVGVTERHFLILDRHTDRTQPAGKRRPQVMDADRLKPSLASRTLPGGVVHRGNRCPAVRKDPDGMLSALLLANRPGNR